MILPMRASITPGKAGIFAETVDISCDMEYPYYRGMIPSGENASRISLMSLSDF